MTSVKVKFRKSTVVGKPGTVYYQVSHASQVGQITTKIHLQPEYWDAENNEILIMHAGQNISQLLQCQLRIANDIQTLKIAVRDWEERGVNYTIADLKEVCHNVKRKNSVLEYMKFRIQRLRQTKRYGTAKNYQCALNSLASFLNGEDILFSMFNVRLVKEYSDFLEESGLVKNSISFYMRIWRAVYNRAVDDGIIGQSYPFKNVYTGIDHTRKRAIDESSLMRLLKLDLHSTPSLEFSRDLFVFSYCARGMAFVDLAFLRTKNIERDMLVYYRRKTCQKLEVRIEPCMAWIIHKYASISNNEGFVFPILKGSTEEERYKQYHAALVCYNRNLKKISDMAGISLPLSSYTSRHTWATTARNHNVPLSVISAGMGHSSEKTTEIYLASLENTIIDEANSDLLSEINKIISV